MLCTRRYCTCPGLYRKKEMELTETMTQVIKELLLI